MQHSPSNHSYYIYNNFNHKFNSFNLLSYHNNDLNKCNQVDLFYLPCMTDNSGYHLNKFNIFYHIIYTWSNLPHNNLQHNYNFYQSYQVSTLNSSFNLNKINISSSIIDIENFSLHNILTSMSIKVLNFLTFDSNRLYNWLNYFHKSNNVGYILKLLLLIT